MKNEIIAKFLEFHAVGGDDKLQITFIWPDYTYSWLYRLLQRQVQCKYSHCAFLTVYSDIE